MQGKSLTYMVARRVACPAACPSLALNLLPALTAFIAAAAQAWKAPAGPTSLTKRSMSPRDALPSGLMRNPPCSPRHRLSGRKFLLGKLQRTRKPRRGTMTRRASSTSNPRRSKRNEPSKTEARRQHQQAAPTSSTSKQDKASKTRQANQTRQAKRSKPDIHNAMKSR